MPPKEKYTDPELRDQVKEEIKESDKGGAPGQWSARKAQMMASEYKKRGGGYNQDKSQKDESQQNLTNWGEEEWQTKEGSGNAKKEDGTEKRYLPKKAWEKMSEEEKKATDQKKQEESKEGKQFVANTDKARESRKKASKGKQQKRDNKDEDDDQEDDDQEEEEDDNEDDAAKSDDEQEYQDDGEADQDNENEDENDEQEDDDQETAKPGQKRKATQNQSKSSSKSQKTSSGKSNSKSNGTIGSKHMSNTEPAPQGSADRLPNKGQKITWKAMPGWVDGEVTEILTAGKKVDGKDVKASKEDPKIVLKSSSSGKVCVHKPEACYYEDE